MKSLVLLFLSFLSFNAYSQLTLDESFATDGFLEYTAMQSAEQICTDSSQRIVCWGKNQSDQDVIMRFLANGEVDTSFGNIQAEYDNVPVSITNIVVQDTDKILFFGRTGQSNSTTLIVGRLDPDGNLDTTFGTNGYFTFEPDYESVKPIALVENQGDFVLAAIVKNDSFYSLLIKLNSNGMTNTSFGDSGSKINDVTSGVVGSDLKIDDSSSIYISGTKNSMGDYYVSKYDDNGTPDSSFGNNGESTTYIGGLGTSHSLQIKDGELFLFGELHGTNDHPLYDYDLTAVAQFDEVSGASLSNDYFYGGSTRFDGGFATYQFENGDFLLGGSLSFSAQGGPSTTKFIRINDNLEVGNTIDFEFYPTTILSYATQDSKVLAAGLRNDNLFMLRLNVGALGVKDHELKAPFLLFPNPSKSFFTIKTNKEIKSVAIYDEMGKKVAHYDGNNSNYDVSQLESGIYFVQINANAETRVEKLIIN